MNTTELTPELLGRLESYLDDTMSGEERELFRKMIESDPELGKWLETLRRVNSGLDNLDYYAFRNLVARTEKEWVRNRKGLLSHQTGLRSYGQLKKLIIPAALVASVLLLFVFTLTFRKKSDPQKLFSKYYERYLPDELVRSDQPTANRLESAIIIYLIQGSAASLPEFREIAKSDSMDKMAWFYLGLAELDLDRADSAVFFFNRIPALWESDYAAHRDWYLAMAHLRLGNLTIARILLNDLASRSVYYAKRARKISRLIRT